MNKTQIGDISEQKFVLYCLEKDIPICKPIGNNLPYDFIIDYNNKLLKIQVKTAYKSSVQDVWIFNTRSTSKNYTEVTTHNYTDLIDYFAVVNVDKNEIIFVHVNEVSAGSMRIYYGDFPKSNQNWYKKYLQF